LRSASASSSSCCVGAGGGGGANTEYFADEPEGLLTKGLTVVAVGIAGGAEAVDEVGSDDDDELPSVSTYRDRPERRPATTAPAPPAVPPPPPFVLSRDSVNELELTWAAPLDSDFPSLLIDWADEDVVVGALDKVLDPALTAFEGLEVGGATWPGAAAVSSPGKTHLFNLSSKNG